MKNSILLILVLFFLSSQSGNDKLKYHKNSKFVESYFDSTTYKSIVSTELITNRDYITYILWKERICGLDYPAVLLDAFPGHDSVNVSEYYYGNSFIRNFYDCKEKNRVQYVVQNSNWIVKNYMFNPKYIDYPVIGLSKKQAMKYCKWLSDRYNEFNLIKKDVFKFSINQVNEDCFISESYEAGQYIGIIKKEINYKWEDRELFCSFRLPTKYELEHVTDSIDYLKKQHSNTFLKPWQKALFKLNIKGFEIITPDYLGESNLFITAYDTTLNLGSIKVIEDVLNEENKSYLEAYQELGYQQKPDSSFMDNEGWLLTKDSIGFMNYIVIGLDKEGKPIQIEQDGFNKIRAQELNEGGLKVYRFAVTIE